MNVFGCTAVHAAVLVWMHIAGHAAGNPNACQERAMVVIVAPPEPYFSWEECNDNGYPTESIDEAKHAGVVKSM